MCSSRAAKTPRGAIYSPRMIMNELDIIVSAPQASAEIGVRNRVISQATWSWLRILPIFAVVVAFSVPLYNLVEFALGSDLYSYILLIPALSGYIAWRKRTLLPDILQYDSTLGIPLLASGGALMGAYFFTRGSGFEFSIDDQLALTTVSFLLTLIGMGAWFLGRAVLGTLAFPIGLLVFAVPIPSGTLVMVENLMQHGSAAVARLLFSLFGTPVFYHELNFQIPGISLYVAPECSGIRSTIALVIVGVVTGHFFLHTTSRRALLATVILPLALLRNGFRIFTVGELCVQFGPHMIDSYLHRHGGPIFFTLSLIPFFGLVILFQYYERRSGSKMGTNELR